MRMIASGIGLRVSMAPKPDRLMPLWLVVNLFG